MNKLDVYRLLSLLVIGAVVVVSGIAHLLNEGDFRVILVAYITGAFALLTPFGATIVTNHLNGKS